MRCLCPSVISLNKITVSSVSLSFRRSINLLHLLQTNASSSFKSRLLKPFSTVSVQWPCYLMSATVFLSHTSTAQKHSQRSSGSHHLITQFIRHCSHTGLSPGNAWPCLMPQWHRRAWLPLGLQRTTVYLTQHRHPRQPT